MKRNLKINFNLLLCTSTIFFFSCKSCTMKFRMFSIEFRYGRRPLSPPWLFIEVNFCVLVLHYSFQKKQYSQFIVFHYDLTSIGLVFCITFEEEGRELLQETVASVMAPCPVSLFAFCPLSSVDSTTRKPFQVVYFGVFVPCSTAYREEFQEEPRGYVRINVLWNFHLSLALPNNQVKGPLLGIFIYVFIQESYGSFYFEDLSCSKLD